jgi:hydrogenase expression/formation protein HypE
MNEIITLSHGNGGKLTQELITTVFSRYFENQDYTGYDSAYLNLSSSSIAFTTDSHVVKPVFFAGGDIGKLSVCGTINDLAVMGARPKFLSVGFILQEGFSLEALHRICQSMADECRKNDVRIVTGDTKVIERKDDEGIYINTSGIGFFETDFRPNVDSIQPDDVIIVSGSIVEHGMAIYAAREGMNFDFPLESDCAAVWPLVSAAMQTSNNIRVMRDPTRGGLATTLIEFILNKKLGINLFQEKIPIREEVASLCEILGFDPLHVACEGRLIVVAPQSDAESILKKWNELKLSENAAIIGHFTSEHAGRCFLHTPFNTTRFVDMLTDDMLPRIC